MWSKKAIEDAALKYCSDNNHSNVEKIIAIKSFIDGAKFILKNTQKE